LTEQASPVGIHREEATMATETPPRQADVGDARGDSGSSPRRWLVPVVVAGVVLLVLLAIVAWPDNGKPADKPQADPTTEKQAIVEAIRGFDRTRDEANNPPNPAHPGFAAFSTGHARDVAVKATQENQQRGIIVRLLPNSQARAHDEVLSIDGGNAIVRECRVDDGLLIEQTTGRVVNDDVVTRLVTIVLVREEGRWKVASTQVDQKWEGVAGCAA
jgi:hypothetical protein